MEVFGIGYLEFFSIFIAIEILGFVVAIVLLVRLFLKRKRAITPVSPTSPETAGAQAPLLETWKTSLGFSILGGFASAIYFVLVFSAMVVAMALVASFMDLPDPIRFSLTAFTTVVVAGISGTVYATLFYPSYFSEHPKLKSNRAISFLNFMFGTVIFGAIWNANLTKKVKGVSNIVLVVLLASWCFGVGSNVAMEVASDTVVDARPYITEQRDGYSFEMPSDWVEQNHYEGVVSYGRPSYVGMNIEEKKLDLKSYTTYKDQSAYLTECVTDYSIHGSENETVNYHFSNQKIYNLNDFAMIQAAQEVYIEGVLNAKHIILLFFVSDNEYVEMRYFARPDEYDISSKVADRIYESVRIEEGASIAASA